MLATHVSRASAVGAQYSWIPFAYMPIRISGM